MDLTLQPAEPADVPLLLEFMQGYYAFEGINYVEDTATQALTRLISSDQFGRVWLIRLQGRAVGYIVLTFGYSLEMGGRDAFIDELFLIEAERGKGVGKRVMELIQAEAGRLGIHALHLEVSRENERAQRVYSAAGFQARQNFFLMTCRLTSEPELTSPKRARMRRYGKP